MERIASELSEFSVHRLASFREGERLCLVKPRIQYLESYFSNDGSVSPELLKRMWRSPSRWRTWKVVLFSASTSRLEPAEEILLRITFTDTFPEDAPTCEVLPNYSSALESSASSINGPFLPIKAERRLSEGNLRALQSKRRGPGQKGSPRSKSRLEAEKAEIQELAEFCVLRGSKRKLIFEFSDAKFHKMNERVRDLVACVWTETLTVKKLVTMIWYNFYIARVPRPLEIRVDRGVFSTFYSRQWRRCSCFWMLCGIYGNPSVANHWLFDRNLVRLLLTFLPATGASSAG